MKKQLRRLLFARTDRMGDVLMNLPAIRLLRLTFPKVWLAVMVDASVADLLKNNPDIDELMVVDAARIRTDLHYRLGLAKKLRRARFGLAVVSNPDKHLHTMMFLAGIPERVGYDRKRGFLLTKKMAAVPDRQGRHEIDRNLDLAKLVSDKHWDGHLVLSTDARSEAAVDARIKADIDGHSDLLAVHTGTSNPRKRWPAVKFAELCDRVATQTRLKPVLIGGAEERAVAREILSACPSPVADWTGAFGLSELVAFLKHPRVAALVSSDSGPVHIAWMSGLPVIAMYAEDVAGSDPLRWGPRDAASSVIHKPMQEITVDEVFRLVKQKELRA